MQKRQDYLICVDSDGCVMDTMNVKHFRCFGPCMIREWELEKWEAPIRERWNEINLYSMTRGINRFQGLYEILTWIDRTYRPVKDLEVLGRWVKNSESLSEASLIRAVSAHPGHPALEKALRWTRAVNRSIEALTHEEKRPFSGAKEALALAHRHADIVVVSGANQKAVEEEWGYWRLLDCVDEILGQEAGSKAACIAMLKEAGYGPGKILMAGDAPGDERAALENGALYYPILVGREAESWKEFSGAALEKFLLGMYEGAYQEEKIKAFRSNLEGSNKRLEDVTIW